jgi:hypothetical protein
MHAAGEPRHAIERLIGKWGHAVLSVGDPRLFLTYTVGLCDRPGRQYELAVTGQGASTAGAVLNATVDQLLMDALDPVSGLELDAVIDRFVVKLRQVPAPDQHAFDAMRVLYGHQPTVWQVLLPDRDGVFPDEPTYRQAFFQPLL